MFVGFCKAWESMHLLSGEGLVGEEGALCSLRPRHSQHLAQFLLNKCAGLDWRALQLLLHKYGGLDWA